MSNDKTEQSIPSKELDRIAGDALYNCPKDAPAGSEAGRWKHGYIQGGKAEYTRAHSLPPSPVGEARKADLIRARIQERRDCIYLLESSLMDQEESDEPSPIPEAYGACMKDEIANHHAFIAELEKELSVLPTPSRAGEADPDFQSKVAEWVVACFGEAIAMNKVERNFRFLEEALELVQANGCSKADALALVDYVYSRPVGEIKQECGGVMVTLASLAKACEISMEECGDTELARVWGKIEQIRIKQAAKKIVAGPLP